MADAVVAAVVAALVSAGLYRAFRFLPEAQAYQRRASAYPLGKDATVVEIGDQPRVRVGGETWRARLAAGTPAVGDTLRVIDGDGITLVCAPADASAIGEAPVGDRPRLLGELGRVVALVLGVGMGALALLTLSVAPLAGGLAVFGFFAPLAVLLALIAVGSPSRGPGFTVRDLRRLVAAACGFAIFLGMTFGMLAAIGAVIAAMVLAALDPALGAILFGADGGGDG